MRRDRRQQPGTPQPPRAEPAHQTPGRVTPTAAPRRSGHDGAVVQRKIQDSHIFGDRGRLDINFAPERDESDGRFGEAGSIRFSPSGETKAGRITLEQIARTVMPNGDDHEWRGPEADREKIKTQAGDGVESGWFIDRMTSALSPRERAADPPVRRDYNASIPEASGEDRLGYSYSKNFLKDVALFDHPAATAPMRWSFETAVKAEREGEESTWGTVRWAFATDRKPGRSDARAKDLSFDEWEVKDESVSFHDGESKSFKAAVSTFDTFYRNPGAETAPETSEPGPLSDDVFTPEKASALEMTSIGESDRRSGNDPVKRKRPPETQTETQTETAKEEDEAQDLAERRRLKRLKWAQLEKKHEDSSGH
jgi:hypothetical protein